MAGGPAERRRVLVAWTKLVRAPDARSAVEIESVRGRHGCVGHRYVRFTIFGITARQQSDLLITTSKVPYSSKTLGWCRGGFGWTWLVLVGALGWPPLWSCFTAFKNSNLRVLVVL